MQLFPKNRIIIGDKDCLIDFSLIFSQKLNHLNRDNKLYVFEGFTHGFLQFDYPNGVQSAEKTIKFAINLLKELLKI